jgi:hypothetical protein
MLLKRFEHSKMSHAAGSVASQCQADLDASQMMNDAFDSVLQQTALICSRSVQGKLKVSFGEFMQLRYIGSDWCVVVEKPHHPEVVSPSGYTLHQ